MDWILAARSIFTGLRATLGYFGRYWMDADTLVNLHRGLLPLYAITRTQASPQTIFVSHAIADGEVYRVKNTLHQSISPITS
jgi:hypothetical protein